MEEKVLSICIPTYNRSSILDRQIYFFYKEIAANPEIKNKVAFLFSDNSSTDETVEVLEKWKKKEDLFNFNVNKKNKGLVGNIRTVFEKAPESKYIWFVSDDDILKKGVILEILSVLERFKEIDFIYLNYSINKKKGVNVASGYNNNPKDTAMEICRESYGALIFMTSSIYKRKNIKDIFNNKLAKKISAPLFFSLYSCSKKDIYITNDVWVEFSTNNASYKGLRNILKIKFEEFIPIYEYLVFFGFEKKQILKTIKIFLEKQSHSHFLYNFIDLKNSIRLYKYYSLKAYIKIPINFYKYFLLK